MSDLTADAAALEARFGVGDLPPELDRVNFGAALAGGFWALIHGCWRWLVLFVVIRLGSNAVFSYLHANQLDDSKSIVLAVAFAVSAIEWTACVIFGMNANRLAWAYESNRIASGRPGSSAYALSVARFQENQRTWLYVGVLWLFASLALSLMRPGEMLWGVERTVIFGACGVVALAALRVADAGRKRALGSS